MNTKNVAIFVGGVVLGAYGMYNHLFNKLVKLVFKQMENEKEKNTDKTE